MKSYFLFVAFGLAIQPWQTRADSAASMFLLRIDTPHPYIAPPRSAPHIEETTGLGKEENTPEKEAPTVVCKPLYHD